MKIKYKCDGCESKCKLKGIVIRKPELCVYNFGVSNWKEVKK